MGGGVARLLLCAGGVVWRGGVVGVGCGLVDRGRLGGALGVVLGTLIVRSIVSGVFVFGHGCGGYSAASTGSFSPNISAALS